MYEYVYVSMCIYIYIYVRRRYGVVVNVLGLEGPESWFDSHYADRVSPNPVLESEQLAGLPRKNIYVCICVYICIYIFIIIYTYVYAYIYK